MAQAFPASTFVGVDAHAGSIEVARERAAEAGLADRITFVAGTAQELAGEGYDLVGFFDALHDMGDPIGAATRAHAALGTQAGPAKLAAVLRAGGFESVRTAVATPFNLVLEAKP